MKVREEVTDAVSGTTELSSRSRWTRLLVDVAIGFVVSKFVFYLCALLQFIPDGAPPNPALAHISPNLLLDASYRWDAAWYQTIIEGGYEHNPGAQTNTAFFPLYPMIVRGLAEIFGDQMWPLLAVLVSHVAFLLGLIVVWLYVEQRFDAEVAGRTTLLVSIFPTAYFFSAMYTEALFLLLIASTLLFLTKSRFAEAAICGFFASLTRSIGAFLLVAYLIEFWRQRERVWKKDWQKLLPGILIPGGIGVFMGFLAVNFGEPFGFSEAQSAWGRDLTFPLLSLAMAVKGLFVLDGPAIKEFANIVHVVVALGSLILAVVLIRHDKAAGFVSLAFVLAHLAYPVEGELLDSFARYMLPIFPLLIPLARWMRRRVVYTLVTTVFLSLNVVMTMLFVNWYAVY